MCSKSKRIAGDEVAGCVVYCLHMLARLLGSCSVPVLIFTAPASTAALVPIKRFAAVTAAWQPPSLSGAASAGARCSTLRASWPPTAP